MIGEKMDIVERLRFDAARCEAAFSKGVASNIEEAVAEIVRLREVLAEARSCLERGAYDLREGGYLRSATVLEEYAAAMNPI
jgi:hypothetical protein